MTVICLNCEGKRPGPGSTVVSAAPDSPPVAMLTFVDGCDQCRSERKAAAGGEQGLSPLEHEVEQLRADRDAWQKRAIAAETDSASWRQTAQEVVDLFDPLKGRWVTPGSLWAVATGAKTANRALRDERDELLAQLALLRVPGGKA